jgi:hypothetical protein
MQNWMSIKSKPCFIAWQDTRRKLDLVMRYRESYSRLPCLYNSIVKRSLINDLANKSANKKFFNSIAPDVFSSIALSSVINKYLLTDYPFSVNGASKHSNGTSFTNKNFNNKEITPVQKFNLENKVSYDARILIAPSIKCVLMGEYMLVKKTWINLRFPEPDWNKYIKELVKESRYSDFSEELLKSANFTARFLEINLPKIRSNLNKRKKTNLFATGFVSDRLNFYFPKHMVSNIFDACIFLGAMVPLIDDIKPSSHIKSSIKRTTSYLYSEFKSLYRNF